MSPKAFVMILLTVFVLLAALNVYVASALRARSPGLARRGYFSAAAFAVGAISVVARAMGHPRLSFVCIGVMLALFIIGIFQKGAIPRP